MSMGFRSLELSRWTRNSSGKRLRYDLASHCRNLGKHYKPQDYNFVDAEKHLIKQLAYEI